MNGPSQSRRLAYIRHSRANIRAIHAREGLTPHVRALLTCQALRIAAAQRFALIDTEAAE